VRLADGRPASTDDGTALSRHAPLYAGHPRLSCAKDVPWTRCPREKTHRPLIPAKAGIQTEIADSEFWIPACAGMSGNWCRQYPDRITQTNDVAFLHRLPAKFHFFVFAQFVVVPAQVSVRSAA
jgi:hypothetical protein